MNGTGELRGRPTGTAKYRMIGCACNAARAGQEMSHRSCKHLAAVKPPVVTFRPTMGGRRTVKRYHAGPHATGTSPTNTETSMATKRTTSDRAGARCSAKEPMPNKPTMRRLTRPCTNKPLQRPRRDHKQTTGKTGQCQTCQACMRRYGNGVHTHEYNRTPQLYHYEPDQPTLTNYTTPHLDKPRHN